MSVSLSSSDLEAIRQLLKLATDNDLAELTITLREGVSITIKSDEPLEVALPAVARQSLSAASPAGLPAPAQHEPPNRVGRKPMPSPMMGIYYESPSPGDPAFVTIGDIVRIGQIIGLIEAMKVFSEVPCEVSGRVVEISAHNGELVQLNQPLLYVEAE